MAIEISSIQSDYIRNIAERVDDGDGKIAGKEYKIFAQEARKAGVEYDAIKCYSHMSDLEMWWHDMDKVCTDDADDGKLGIGEIAKSTVKGFLGNVVKSIVNHPIATGVTLALGAAALKISKGALAPALTALGATLGAGTIAFNGIKAASAKTDAEAKEAWEGVGTGLFATTTSVLGAKSALQTGAKGGVESAFGSKSMNPFEALVQCFKATPESIKVSSANIANVTKIPALAIGAAKTPLKTPEQIEAHIANSEKYGFEIRPEKEAFFNEQMEGIAKDSWGSESAARDMRKVMAGLEEMNFNGNMTLEGYTNLSKSVDTGLPRSYWRYAINLYNQCAKNADANRTWAVVGEYISGYNDMYMMSPTAKFIANNIKPMTPVLGTSTVVSGK